MSITRYELTIFLETTSPLHSGGVEETVNRAEYSKNQEVNDFQSEERRATAQHFARDGLGRAYLPGRSIKGAIRAACERAAGQELKDLWGGETQASVLTVHPILLPEKEVIEPDPQASKSLQQAGGHTTVRMLGETQESARLGLRSRPGIAIDRYWGAVGDGALFVHEVLPAGTRLELKLSAHVDSRSGIKPAHVESLLRLIVDLFDKEAITFGKRQGAGWGRVKLAKGTPDDSTFLTKTTINSPEGLLAWLGGGSEKKIAEIATEDDWHTESHRVQFTIGWCSPTGILVADPERREERQKIEQDSEDKKPTPTEQWRDREGEQLIIPGSSIRGALRNRATRIARTVLFGQGKMSEDTGGDWSDLDVHEQLASDVPLIHDLFGTTERRGAIRVRDVHSVSLGETFTVTHNAGDRWTGGVKEGGLYSEEYYRHAEWKPIVIEVDADFLYRPQVGASRSDDPLTRDAYVQGRRRASLILLGLALAELATGTLPLGSRGTRGLGEVQVKDMSVSGSEELFGTKEWTLKGGGQAVAQRLLERLRALNDDIDGNWTDYLTLPDPQGREVSVEEEQS